MQDCHQPCNVSRQLDSPKLIPIAPDIAEALVQEPVDFSYIADSFEEDFHCRKLRGGTITGISLEYWLEFLLTNIAPRYGYQAIVPDDAILEEFVPVHIRQGQSTTERWITDREEVACFSVDGLAQKKCGTISHIMLIEAKCCQGEAGLKDSLQEIIKREKLKKAIALLSQRYQQATVSYSVLVVQTTISPHSQIVNDYLAQGGTILSIPLTFDQFRKRLLRSLKIRGFYFFDNHIRKRR